MHERLKKEDQVPCESRLAFEDMLRAIIDKLVFEESPLSVVSQTIQNRRSIQYRSFQTKFSHHFHREFKIDNFFVFLMDVSFCSRKFPKNLQTVDDFRNFFRNP